MMLSIAIACTILCVSVAKHMADKPGFPPALSLLPDGRFQARPIEEQDCPSHYSSGDAFNTARCNDARTGVVNPIRFRLHVSQENYRRVLSTDRWLGLRWVRVGTEAVSFSCPNFGNDCLIVDAIDNVFSLDECAPIAVASDNYEFMEYSAEAERRCGRPFPDPNVCSLFTGGYAKTQCLRGEGVISRRKH